VPKRKAINFYRLWICCWEERALEGSHESWSLALAGVFVTRRSR